MANVPHGRGVLLASATRIPELDGIRGIAVLMVLLLHTHPATFFWGWAGVDLFLVLSGFLITRIVLEHRGRTGMLRAFYIRRTLRIWPVYYLTLLLVAGLFMATAPLAQHSPEIPAGHWLGLVFLQNTEHYLGVSDKAVGYIWYFEHSWSVAVEEQFYLIWPGLLLLCSNNRRSLLLLGIAALAGAYAARANAMSIHLLLTRIDGLVAGAAIAVVSMFHPEVLFRIRLRYLAFVAGAAAALVAPYLIMHSVERGAPPGDRAPTVLGFSILFALALWISLRHSGHAHLRWLRHPLLRWIGQISFGLYMYHVPIGYLGLLGTKMGLWNLVVAKILMWVGGLAVAQLSFRYLEQPVLRLKERVPYARPDRTASLATADIETERVLHVPVPPGSR